MGAADFRQRQRPYVLGQLTSASVSARLDSAPQLASTWAMAIWYALLLQPLLRAAPAAKDAADMQA